MKFVCKIILEKHISFISRMNLLKVIGSSSMDDIFNGILHLYKQIHRHSFSISLVILFFKAFISFPVTGQLTVVGLVVIIKYSLNVHRREILRHDIFTIVMQLIFQQSFSSSIQQCFRYQILSFYYIQKFFVNDFFFFYSNFGKISRSDEGL